MCHEQRCDGDSVDRRSFLSGSAALVGLATSAARGSGQEKDHNPLRAIHDPGILQQWVEFKSGQDTIDGCYLARPKGDGPFTPVLVVPGNWSIEPYIPETAAMLAQAGYVGLVVNLLHFFPKVKSYAEADKVPWETTQGLIQKEYSDERMIRNVQSGIDYVRSKSFSKDGRVGMVGFCGGGWQSLLCAAELKDIAAVVPFYAPVSLKLPGRRTPMDVVKKIKVPVQGHYGTKDKGIPLADVRNFEQALRGQNVPIEILTYDAGHGFFAYNRDEAYQEQAAKLAWSRALMFLQKNLT